MPDLWDLNTPSLFWQLQPDPPPEVWQVAIESALPILGLPEKSATVDAYLEQTLGEGQFGADHWRLSSTRRLYYMIKPVLPRLVINGIKQISARQSSEQEYRLGWPIEDRYARFLWEVARQILIHTPSSEISFRLFWPDHKRFAFVLTHDVEGEKGLQFIEQLADLEESLGFRSSFNFVPRGYNIPPDLRISLHKRGFEIGIHGLRHDGKLFNSKDQFIQRARLINEHLKEFNASGFRAPLMHRQPEWLQALQVEYDLSFFDTDPYEPLPGGTMCIWPFFLGHFVEMPYTLVQDSTLMHVLDQDSPGIWLQKIEFLAQYHGMALLNSHPDYLRADRCLHIYAEFLRTMRERNDYWHALPGEVATWWRARVQENPIQDHASREFAFLSLQDDQLVIQ